MSLSGFFASLLEAIESLPDQSRAFTAVSIAVVVLVVVSALFSAYALWLRARNALRARAWQDRESRWTGLTLEAMVGERTVDDLAVQVGARERLSFLEFLLRYARRLRGREREKIKELAAPFLPVLEPLLDHRDAYRRARAVQTLGTLGSAGHSETLVRAVHDPSPFVSMLAARALAVYGGSEYAKPILSNLDRFEHWGSEYVTSLLVSLGTDAAPALREVLQDEGRTARIRAIVADALRSLHDLEAVRTAVGLLSPDSDPDLAASLLRLLRVLGGPEHLDVVRELLEHPHFAVRAEAYSALGALAGDEDEATLEDGLRDPSPWVALHAARAKRDRGKDAWLRRLSASDRPGALAAGQVLAEE